MQRLSDDARILRKKRTGELVEAAFTSTGEYHRIGEVQMFGLGPAAVPNLVVDEEIAALRELVAHLERQSKSL
jgi:hypothetical protein